MAETYVGRILTMNAKNDGGGDQGWVTIANAPGTWELSPKGWSLAVTAFVYNWEVEVISVEDNGPGNKLTLKKNQRN